MKGMVGGQLVELPNRIPYQTMSQVRKGNKDISVVTAYITRFEVAIDNLMLGAVLLNVELDKKIPEQKESRQSAKYKLWPRRNQVKGLGILMRSIMELFPVEYNVVDGFVKNLQYPSDMVGKKAYLVIRKGTDEPIGLGSHETGEFLMQSEISKWACENMLDGCFGDTPNPLAYLGKDTVEELRGRIEDAKKKERIKARKLAEIERERNQNKRIQWTEGDWSKPEIEDIGRDKDEDLSCK